MSRRASLWAPVALWCAVIFLFSSAAGSGAPPGPDWPLRKLAHVIEYAVLWRLAWRALRPDLSPRRAGWAALVFSIVYAASDEWHQTFVPFRQGRLADVGFDIAGAALAFRYWR